MSTNVSKLVKECENRVGWASEWWYSFTGNFEKVREGISYELKDEKEKYNFIEICDNRIELAKTFLQDIATALGFFITSLAIVLALSGIEQGKRPIDPGLALFTDKYSNLFPILIVSLLAGIGILAVLLIHYRTHIHAWASFKEGVILKGTTNK